MKNNTKITAVTLCISFLLCIIIFMVIGCEKETTTTTTTNNLQYVQTELGGCNEKDYTKSDDYETESDTVIITISDSTINAFVGINYTCKSKPFETKIEIIDDVVYMHIIDGCRACKEGNCYFRCTCYYTFDFAFKYEEKINQKYKILLHGKYVDDGKISVISEGIINSKNR